MAAYGVADRQNSGRGDRGVLWGFADRTVRIARLTGMLPTAWSSCHQVLSGAPCGDSSVDRLWTHSREQSAEYLGRVVQGLVFRSPTSGGQVSRCTHAATKDRWQFRSPSMNVSLGRAGAAMGWVALVGISASLPCTHLRRPTSPDQLVSVLLAAPFSDPAHWARWRRRGLDGRT